MSTTTPPLTLHYAGHARFDIDTKALDEWLSVALDSAAEELELPSVAIANPAAAIERLVNRAVAKGAITCPPGLTVEVLADDGLDHSGIWVLVTSRDLWVGIISPWSDLHSWHALNGSLSSQDEVGEVLANTVDEANGILDSAQSPPPEPPVAGGERR